MYDLPRYYDFVSTAFLTQRHLHVIYYWRHCLESAMAPASLAGLLQLPAKKEDNKPPTLPAISMSCEGATSVRYPVYETGTLVT